MPDQYPNPTDNEKAGSNTDIRLVIKRLLCMVFLLVIGSLLLFLMSKHNPVSFWLSLILGLIFLVPMLVVEWISAETGSSSGNKSDKYPNLTDTEKTHPKMDCQQ